MRLLSLKQKQSTRVRKKKKEEKKGSDIFFSAFVEVLYCAGTHDAGANDIALTCRRYRCDCCADEHRTAHLFSLRIMSPSVKRVSLLAQYMTAFLSSIGAAPPFINEDQEGHRLLRASLNEGL